MNKRQGEVITDLAMDPYIHIYLAAGRFPLSSGGCEKSCDEGRSEGSKVGRNQARGKYVQPLKQAWKADKCIHADDLFFFSFTTITPSSSLQLMNSEALKSHFQENPHEFQVGYLYTPKKAFTISFHFKVFI